MDEQFEQFKAHIDSVLRTNRELRAELASAEQAHNEAVARGVALWEYGERITYVLDAIDRVLNERAMYHASRAIAITKRLDALNKELREARAEVTRLREIRGGDEVTALFVMAGFEEDPSG